GVTAVSEFLREATQENFEIGSKDIRVIPNFVDVNRFQRQDKDHFRKMISGNGEKILIHTSNFRKVKRIEDVLNTFAIVRKEIPSRLMMVGDGPERSKAEELCRQIGMCDDIVFLGNQNKVEEIYSIGDIFLMPSASESFGLAALEAMACEVPVISSNAGGLPELVVDGKTGFTSPIGNVEKMAADAISLLKDEAKWKEFSQAAKNHAHNFTIEKIVPHYERYYEEVSREYSSVI
ncbi:MAG: N-acetyl-alpha-D-glucosaminyl L-malate synthase BshA, partial [Bacteroidota bacterium]